MSVCVGQSLRQPLQARHQSSASFTSSLCQPSVITSPRSISAQQPRAAARRVALLARGAVARAHGAARLGSGTCPCRCSARLRARSRRRSSLRKASALASVTGLYSRPQAQVLVDARPAARRSSLPGFMRPRRIPDALELAERLHQLRAVHRAAGTRRVAWPSPCSPESEPPYFTTSAAASRRKRAPVREALGRAQLEIDARVDAAVAEMAVERGAVAVAVHQRLEFAQVVAQAQRVDRRVLPADDRVRRRALALRLSAVAEAPVSRIAHRRAIARDPRSVTPQDRASALAPLRSPPRACRRRTRPSARRCPRGSSAMSSSLRLALAQAADDAVVEALAGDRPGGEDLAAPRRPRRRCRRSRCTSSTRSGGLCTRLRLGLQRERAGALRARPARARR